MKLKKEIEEIKTSWTAEEVVEIIYEIARNKIGYSISIGTNSAERYLSDKTNKDFVKNNII